jgi:NitT/TauT family transport system substrate-binding protein
MKKIYAFIAVFTFALCFTHGCSQSKHDAATIRLAYLQNDLHHLPAFVALEKGFFADEDLKVEVTGIFRAGPEEMSAFAAGELDAGYVGLAPAATAALNGVADISILAQVNTEGSGLVCRSAITSIKQLPGTTVAIPGHATMQDCLIQKGLQDNGLNARDMRLMVLKPPEMAQAVKSGNIDCFIAWEPYPAQAEAAGTGAVIARSSELWKGHPCCVLIAHGRFVRTRPDAAAKIIRAHRQACRFIAEHPEEALGIAVHYTGLPHGTIRKAMDHIHYAPDIDREKIDTFTGFLSDLNYVSPARDKGQLNFFTED